jgi:UDP-N-acetylmuramate--alanine ligase
MDSQHIHFIGIGGIGMSALAKILREEGYTVSGSDLKLSPLTESLSALGITVYQGHRPEHIAGADLIVTTSAARPDNPEILAGQQRGVPVIKGSTMLGRMMAGRRAVCIAGTHGKTTTTAMIAKLLVDAGRDPTFVIGGESEDLGTNGRHGDGTEFVAEADEFDRRFLDLTPHIAVVTNIEADHLDVYGDLAGVVEAFRQFIGLVPPDGAVVACVDDPQVRQLVVGAALRGRPPSTRHLVTYGVERPGEWWAAGLSANARGGYDFTAWHRGRCWGEIGLRVPGLHNVGNALAAIAVAELLGIASDVARESLASYRGTRRRFEFKGEAGGVRVYDDYAHHPTEIQTTLAAARDLFPDRKLWVVFQPHTYSRTKALLRDFARSFNLADHVLVTDIYAARESDTLGVHSRQLVTRMNQPDARYVGDLDQAAETLAAELRPGDVLFSLGAGDVWWVGEQVLRMKRKA